jgi:hypothetical protein
MGGVKAYGLLSPALSSRGGEGEDKPHPAAGYPLLITPL